MRHNHFRLSPNKTNGLINWQFIYCTLGRYSAKSFAILLAASPRIFWCVPEHSSQTSFYLWCIPPRCQPSKDAPAQECWRGLLKPVSLARPWSQVSSSRKWPKVDRPVPARRCWDGISSCRTWSWAAWRDTPQGTRSPPWRLLGCKGRIPVRGVHSSGGCFRPPCWRFWTLENSKSSPLHIPFAVFWRRPF